MLALKMSPRPREHLPKHFGCQHAGVGVVARAVIARKQRQPVDFVLAVVAEGAPAGARRGVAAQHRYRSTLGKRSQ